MKFRIGVVEACLKQPDPAAAAAAARKVGVDCLQVYYRPERAAAGESPRPIAQAWRRAAEAAGIAVASAVLGFPQEDYSSIAAIHRTGGLLPDDLAEANIRRVIDALDFTSALTVDLLTFHAGFIPEDRSDPAFAKMLDRLGRCADAAAERGARIGLESGQESAIALRGFLAALGRSNVGCNFDPANMILYGRQEPLAAVNVLAGRIFQVHAKDGTWSDKPGEAWGKEMALGQGDVNFPELLPKLAATGFAGDLVIEREAGRDPLGDIAGAVRLLRSLQ